MSQIRCTFNECDFSDLAHGWGLLGGTLRLFFQDLWFVSWCLFNIFSTYFTCLQIRWLILPWGLITFTCFWCFKILLFLTGPQCILYFLQAWQIAEVDMVWRCVQSVIFELYKLFFCCLFVFNPAFFSDPFRGCSPVRPETSALVSVQGSSHQQPWQQRLHHTQQALHVQQRWCERTLSTSSHVFTRSLDKGLLLIYLSFVHPDPLVNFTTLSWDSEQYWISHSICVISLDFTSLRGRVRNHPFCLIREQSYQAVHKTQRIPTRTWAHVYIHSTHIHVLCSFLLGARVKFLEWKREQDSVLSLTKTLPRRSNPNA